MATLTKLGMLALALILTASSTVRADFLRLEQDGMRQIMSQIKARAAGGQVFSEFSYQSRAGTQVVNVAAPLAARILVDGRPSGIQLYRAKVNENAAVLVLTNETMKLSYGSRRSKKILRRVVFSERDAETSIGMPEHPTDPRGEGHGIDSEVKLPPEFMPTRKEKSIDALATGNQPITIYVFKHNDVQESIENLILEHFSWWIQQMSNTNKRHISEGNSPLFSEIVVDFRTDAGIQRFDYRGEPERKLKALATRMRTYKSKHLPESSYRRTKFLLLVEHALDKDTMGVAYTGGQYGIAADDDDHVPAHELSHMFGGRHTQAEVVYDGEWCETILYWYHAALRANCHYYTDGNTNVITGYLSQ